MKPDVIPTHESGPERSESGGLNEWGAAQLAGMLDMDKSHLSRLVRDCVIDRLPSGKFDAVAATVQYIRHLRKNIVAAKRKTDTEKASESEVRMMLAREKVKQLEIQNQILLKQRIPISVILKINQETLSNIAQLIKSRKGKVLDESTISDIYSEVRTNAQRLGTVTEAQDTAEEVRPAMEEEAIDGIAIIKKRGRPRKIK